VTKRTRYKHIEAAARTYIDQKKAGWKNANHAAQWTSTLETYLFPHIASTGITRPQQYYGPVRLPFRIDAPSTPLRPLPRRIEWVRASIASPLMLPSPVIQAGRQPHHHFRGLLRLHSHYGPLDCSTAQGGLRHEGFDPTGYPAKPLVSYQTYRQSSG
jgi:hypothetical protein